MSGCPHRNKMTLFYESLADGGQQRHWICRDCQKCGADPPSSAN
jgi:hypothetical protein